MENETTAKAPAKAGGTKTMGPAPKAAAPAQEPVQANQAPAAASQPAPNPNPTPTTAPVAAATALAASPLQHVQAAPTQVKETTEDMVLVFDPSAPNEFDEKTKELVKRVHEIMLEGAKRQFYFQYGQGTKMPRAAGMKFLASGFDVREIEGKIIKAAPKGPDIHSTERFVLGAEQVVANYDELTSEALLKRVNATYGGDGFSSQSQRSEMVAFLLAHRRKEAAEISAAINSRAGLEADEMTAEELARIDILNAA